MFGTIYNHLSVISSFYAFLSNLVEFELDHCSMYLNYCILNIEYLYADNVDVACQYLFKINL